jgi:hypothetical protein
MQRFRWAAVVAAVILAAAVGLVAFNAGVAHGLAIGAAAGAAVTPPLAPFGPWAYGWYRPWGFGFFGPIGVLFLWFFVFRVLFWGGFHRRRWMAHGSGVPPTFDEWHRRAHERMNGAATVTEHS